MNFMGAPERSVSCYGLSAVAGKNLNGLMRNIWLLLHSAKMAHGHRASDAVARTTWAA
ncbi:hypothetical protein PSEUDO8O_30355 [Pseudomonas sp. 8O]|nr:hypothetical protein PSEUDO8O_30355 [Pseudomonas sp. 8O]